MKSLFEQNGGTYCKQSDYLIPNLTLPKSEENAIGIYGQRHLRFFTRAPQIDLYQFTYKREQLNEYLSKIDKQARERFCRIVRRLKTTQGITEQLKANSPMEWVKKMNCIRQQADESVFAEIIYK